MERTLHALAQRVAQERGVSAPVTWIRHHSVTQNTSEFAQLARDAARSVPGIEVVRDDYRTMAGEDFGEILAEVGGAYALLGSGKADGTSFPHHSPYFDIEESSLELAVSLHCEVVRHYGMQLVENGG